MHMFQHFAPAFVQRDAVVWHIAQGQRAVAAQVNVPYLDVRLKIAEVILRRELVADLAIALFVVDRRDLEIML